MSEDKSAELIEKLDDLWNTFIKCRSVIPFVPPKYVGVKGVISAPFYSEFSSKMYLYAKIGLTADDIQMMNKSGHFVNMSVIVRIYALLDLYGIKLDKSVEGFEDINILRRLRNKIVHSSGKFNPSKSEHKRLNKEMVKQYSLATPPNDPDEFRLPIDTVIEPMFRGCKTYAVEYLKRNKSIGNFVPHSMRGFVFYDLFLN